MAINPLTVTAAELQAMLTANFVTSKQLVDLYLGSIARHNDYLKAVIATTPKDVLYQRATQLEEYDMIIKHAREACGINGIDKVLEDNDVDILMGPGDGAMFAIPGTAGK